jgi:hypothetical protein
MFAQTKSPDSFRKMFELESGRQNCFDVQVKGSLYSCHELTEFRISVTSYIAKQELIKELTMGIDFDLNASSVSLHVKYTKNGKDADSLGSNPDNARSVYRNSLSISDSGDDYEKLSYHRLLGAKESGHGYLLLHAAEAYTDYSLVNVLPNVLYANPEFGARIVEIASILTDLKDSILLTHAIANLSFLRD